MKVPRWNSFVGGFTTAMLLLIIAFVWTHFKMQGGISRDSPDGQVTLRAMGPLGGSKGGTYTIKLIDKDADSVLKRVEITFASNESTAGLREGGGDIRWDSQSKYVDLIVAEDPVIRLWVPSAESRHDH